MCERIPIEHGGAATRARLMAPVAVACVALQYPAEPVTSALAVVLWVAATAVVDRPALWKLWQPRFLALSAVIALLSGLLLGTPDARLLGVPVSRDGFAAGAVMFLRGVLLVAIGGALARWLTGYASADRLARRNGVSAAAAAAFELVPELGARIRAARANGRTARGLAGFEHAAVSLLHQTALIAEGLASRKDSGTEHQS